MPIIDIAKKIPNTNIKALPKPSINYFNISELFVFYSFFPQRSREMRCGKKTLEMVNQKNIIYIL